MGIHARRDRAGWGWVPRDNFDCRGGGGAQITGNKSRVDLKKFSMGFRGEGGCSKAYFRGPGGGCVCLTTTRKSLRSHYLVNLKEYHTAENIERISLVLSVESWDILIHICGKWLHSKVIFTSLPPFFPKYEWHTT